MLRQSIVAVLLAAVGIVSAQTPSASDIDIRIMGVSFIEAPPGRDKNLTAFGVMGTQEKVEVNALAVSRTRLFVEAGGSLFDKGDVKVTAIMPDKSSLAIGDADLGGFPKLSANGQIRSFNVSVNRLPDRPVTGLVFEGTIPLTVAKSISKSDAPFDPSKPGALKLGGAQISSFKVDGQSVEFKGNDTLTRVKSVSLKLPNGQSVSAERGAWARMGSDYSQTWKFSAPLAKGNLQADVYDGLETIKHPLRLVVGRPW